MSELKHYGIKRKSGRYPWGSGADPFQSEGGLVFKAKQLQDKGYSEAQAAKKLGMTTVQLRARKTRLIAQQRAADQAFAQRLKDKGYSNVAVGERMGINESTVRSLLNPATAARSNEMFVVAEQLKKAIDERNFIDVGRGVENHIGIARTKLMAAISMLEDDGYVVHKLSTRQVGTGHETTIMTINKPGTEWVDVNNNKDRISMINKSDMNPLDPKLPPKSISSDRVKVVYAEDGGADKDGVIEIRRGVEDISLGNSRYAQVRIGVDDKYYLKGMAVYSDDMPDGVDILYNVTKSKKDGFANAVKGMEDDPLNPFGASTTPKMYIDKNGKEQQSVHNIIYEEGDWDKWSKSLSSQMLSKQRPKLVKRQLDLQRDIKQAEFDTIMNLNNAAVKKRLLAGFADDADSASTQLKAAALPRQKTHVILPYSDIKETEIYAPNYRDGENVVLVRFPHGGIFEIPQLTVNNRGSALARKQIRNAPDAVGINPKVAGRLSGADFDGDTVLVIPNGTGAVRVSSALEGLKNFETQTAYPGYPGMPKVSPKTGFRMPLEMGGISNLITDMTIGGANPNEIAAAIRHSMVVIDAEKHNLNYKQSYIDNNIASLKKKWQGGASAGASTLVSRAKSELRVPERDKYFKIDKDTGKKIYKETGREYTDISGNIVKNTTKTNKLAEVDDAHELSSGTLVEEHYANYSNSMKAMANAARKEYISTPNTGYSPEAKKAYRGEVDSLTAKLNIALKNAPLERQAQLVANEAIKAKKEANPHLYSRDHNSEYKKELTRMSAQSLEEARLQVGAKKDRIDFTEKEWEAVQAGAISNNMLTKILNNADLDEVKKLATPLEARGMSPAMAARARTMLKRGYTQAEVASQLGVSTSAVQEVAS